MLAGVDMVMELTAPAAPTGRARASEPVSDAANFEQHLSETEAPQSAAEEVPELEADAAAPTVAPAPAPGAALTTNLMTVQIMASGETAAAPSPATDAAEQASATPQNPQPSAAPNAPVAAAPVAKAQTAAKPQATQRAEATTAETGPANDASGATVTDGVLDAGAGETAGDKQAAKPASDDDARANAPPPATPTGSKPIGASVAEATATQAIPEATDIPQQTTNAAQTKPAPAASYTEAAVAKIAAASSTPHSITIEASAAPSEGEGQTSTQQQPSPFSAAKPDRQAEPTDVAMRGRDSAAPTVAPKDTYVPPAANMQTQAPSAPAPSAALGAQALPIASGADLSPSLATAAHTPTPHPAAQVTREIIRKFDGANTRFELRLDPPELGRVEVRLEVSRDHRVTAIVAADSPQALAELTRHARDIEQALQSSGLELNEDGLSFDLSQQRQGFTETEDQRGANSVQRAENDTANPTAARALTLDSWRGLRVDLVA